MVQRKRTEQRLDALSRERGATLLETALAVATLAILLAFGSSVLGRNPYALRSAVARFAALMADARALARTSGSGATVTVEPEGEHGFRARLYRYRPLPGTQLDAAPVRTVHVPVALAGGAESGWGTFALFISSSGSASAAAWTADSGSIETEPPCPSAIPLTFADGARIETHTIGCADATFR